MGFGLRGPDGEDKRFSGEVFPRLTQVELMGHIQRFVEDDFVADEEHGLGGLAGLVGEFDEVGLNAESLGQDDAGKRDGGVAFDIAGKLG